MAEIVDLTPPFPFSLEEQNAARLSLSKSRFFLVLGLAPAVRIHENRVPETVTTCSNPDLVLKLVYLKSAGSGKSPQYWESMTDRWAGRVSGHDLSRAVNAGE